MDFIKHPQERKKDVKTLQMIEEFYQSKPVYCNHERASRFGSRAQKQVNPMVEQMFHMLLKKVKKLCATLPNKEDRVIVELNLKSMPTDCFGLYSILTSTFYFSIECDIKSDYRIEYQFHNCKFKDEVMKTISHYALTAYSSERTRVTDYPSYFTKVLQVQPERFIHLLEYQK